MKISKQLLLIALILFIFFASGCSRNLLHLNGPEPDSGVVGEENADKEDTASRLYEKPSPRSFGSAEQGMPGNGASGSFSAEPESELAKEGIAGEVGTPSRLYEKPDPRSFGSAEQGMPGNGASGSFSAEPFTGSSPEPASEFSPEPASEFSKEGIAGEVDSPSRLYEKPDPREFGSAEQGMPGNGASGSFSAEPFIEETVESFSEETAEPFLEESGVVAQLPKEEEVRRQLQYSPSDHLQDIHFAFDKFDLDDKARAILKQNADYLKVHPNTRIEIQGHCDERGSNNYNINLGERRTQSAKAYLVSLGVDESQIHTISYGEEKPFCFESNEKCWYQNRRGHFLMAK